MTNEGPVAIRGQVVSAFLEPLDILHVNIRLPLVGNSRKFRPGSIVSIEIAPGVNRSYSLLPAPMGSVNLAIRLTGSSTQTSVIGMLAVGRHVNLTLAGTPERIDASSHLHFIAGGIGITSIYPKIVDLCLMNPDASWHLDYIVRDASHLIFWSELKHLADHSSGSIRTHVSSIEGRPNLNDLIDINGLDPIVCGPSTLTQAVAELVSNDTSVEVAPSKNPAGSDCLKTVLVNGEDLGIRVDRGQPILDGLESAGVEVPTSCRRGICGTCELSVLSGEFSHLDQVLSTDEKQSHNSVIPCVSTPISDCVNLGI